MAGGAPYDQAQDLRALYNGSGVLPESNGALAPMPSEAALPPLSPGGAEKQQQQQQQQQPQGLWKRFKASVKKLKREILALHYATQDSRVGLLSRIIVFIAVAYALSPLDLIPDFIPVLGVIDDVLILGALLGLAVWLMPADVMEAARERAEREPLRLHKNWGMALLFFAMWDALLLALAWWGCTTAAKAHPEVAPYTVWIVAGVGLVAAAAELAWAVSLWRKESRLHAVLAAAGTQPELQEALLRGGSEAVQAYLEP